MILKFLRGTEAQWLARTTPLADGEPGYARDTGVLKIGNGIDLWAALPSFIAGSLDDSGSAELNIAYAVAL